MRRRKQILYTFGYFYNWLIFRGQRKGRYGHTSEGWAKDERGACGGWIREEYLQECAKENSLNLVRRGKSCANGEGRKRRRCNQGWGRGILFLPCHHQIWFYGVWLTSKLETR
jgi:hypothetical protein